MRAIKHHKHELHRVFDAVKNDYFGLKMENSNLASRCNELAEVVKEYQQYAINIDWRINEARRKVQELRAEQY